MSPRTKYFLLLVGLVWGGAFAILVLLYYSGVYPRTQTAANVYWLGVIGITIRYAWPAAKRRFPT